MNNSYWAKELPHPLSPSFDDFDIYKDNLISGTTLLLGCTHKLIPISTNQMDIDPWYKSPTMIIKDWRENDQFYDNIIGDGVLNFTKDLTCSILNMCQKNSALFLTRCFNQKLPNMKIAEYFPKYNDFSIKPDLVLEYNYYNFFLWRFYE